MRLCVFTLLLLSAMPAAAQEVYSDRGLPFDETDTFWLPDPILGDFDIVSCVMIALFLVVIIVYCVCFGFAVRRWRRAGLMRKPVETDGA